MKSDQPSAVPPITLDELLLALTIMQGVWTGSYPMDDMEMPGIEVDGERVQFNPMNPLARMMLAIKTTFGQERFMPVMERLMALMHMYGDERFMPYCRADGAIQECVLVAITNQPLVSGALKFAVAALMMRLPCPQCSRPMAHKPDGGVEFSYAAREARLDYCLHCGQEALAS